MTAAIVALALALAAASGTAVVLAIRGAGLQTETWQARAARERAESSLALTADELTTTTRRLGAIIDARDETIRSLRAQLVAIEGAHRMAVDRIADLLASDSAARDASARLLAGPVPDDSASPI